jgi:hypothetical protein
VKYKSEDFEGVWFKVIRNAALEDTMDLSAKVACYLCSIHQSSRCRSCLAILLLWHIVSQAQLQPWKSGSAERGDWKLGFSISQC